MRDSPPTTLSFCAVSFARSTGSTWNFFHVNQQSRLDQLLQLLQLYFKLLLLFLFISLAIGDAPSFASTYGATPASAAGSKPQG